MPYNAAGGNIKIGNTDMDYASFGKGSRNLVIIPGLGDGLKTVKGLARALSVTYKCFANSFKVYVISRKNHIEEGYSIRDMAADYATVIKELGITRTDLIGVSQGGMIAQYVAIDYPELINKLVLVVTIARQNESVQKAVRNWLAMAKVDGYADIYIDTAEMMYTEKRLKRLRPLYPLLSRIGKPKDLSRFIIQANACLAFDSYDELFKIKCPVFIIGADGDKIVGPDAPFEIAANIENSKLLIYNGYGHGVYEEAKDFNDRLLEFLGE